MRRLQLIFFCCLPLSTLSAASVTVYYDQAEWQQVLIPSSVSDISFDSSLWSVTASMTTTATLLTSSSSSAASNGMSVSIVSQFSAPGVATAPLGQPENGVWVDNISKYGETTFSFSQPIYAFGGTFSIAGGNGLYFSVGGMVPYPYYASEYPPLTDPYSSYNGFIGIVSETPISDLLVSWGDNGSCYCFGNSYSLSQFAVSTQPDPPMNAASVPEPNLRVFIAMLLGCMALRILRSRHRACRCNN